MTTSEYMNAVRAAQAKGREALTKLMKRPLSGAEESAFDIGFLNGAEFQLTNGVTQK